MSWLLTPEALSSGYQLLAFFLGHPLHLCGVQLHGEIGTRVHISGRLSARFLGILSQVLEAFASSVFLGFCQIEFHLVERLFLVPGHIHPVCQGDGLGLSLNALYKQRLEESFLECCYGAMMVASPSCFVQEVLELDDVVVRISRFLP